MRECYVMLQRQKYLQTKTNKNTISQISHSCVVLLKYLFESSLKEQCFIHFPFKNLNFTIIYFT